MIIGKSGSGKTTLLTNNILRTGWRYYNNVNIFDKSLFQPVYHIFKAFEEKLPKNLGISPISIVEEMANEIRDKSDVVCNF